MNRSPFVILIGAVLVIAILVVGWFGLVAPQIATASANSVQAAAVEQGNTQRSIALQQFATQNKQLPALRKKLAHLQEAIPTTSQLDVFLGELNSLASASGVTIDGVTPGEALPYSASTSTSTSTGTGSSAATPTPTPVPTAPTTTTTPTTSATGLYTIAVTITVAGTQSQVVAFSKALQSGLRLFLLTTMSFQGSGIGLPASGSLSGYIFVAPEATGSAGAGSVTTSTATPTPSATSTSTPTATPTPTKKP
jgi:Tfp pilus assembly protein PilO